MKKTPHHKIKTLFEEKARNPKLGAGALALKAGMGKTTVRTYLNIAQMAGISPLNIVCMSDAELEKLFGALGKDDQSFVEPDWEDVRSYINQPRVAGRSLPSLRNAWTFIYLKQKFPEYSSGNSLPQGCMSLSTFKRRYSDYLEEKKLLVSAHNPSPSLNFGPASMLEIDMIGDAFLFVDEHGITHTTYIFTAVLKYSGLIYAEAVEKKDCAAWYHCITNAFYTIGGITEVIRSDNDSAITIHGSKSRGTETVFKPEIIDLYRQLFVHGERCPVRRPQYKGSCENANSIIVEQLFADPSITLPVHTKDLASFNALIATCIERINLMERAKGQLSRRAMFEETERMHLKPLPPKRPVFVQVRNASGNDSGYVTYKENYYFIGKQYHGQKLLLKITNDLKLNVLEPEGLKSIHVYDVVPTIKGVPKYIKADCFKTAREKAVSRDRAWYENFFSSECQSKEIDPNSIIEIIHLLWKLYPHSQATAIRQCNKIASIAQKKADAIVVLSHACRLMIERYNQSQRFEFDELIKVFKSLEKIGVPITEHADSNKHEERAPSDTTNDTCANLRGGDYYA